VRGLRDESRRVIASMQAGYIEQTGARTLRIKHNNFLGYFIEVPQAVGDQLMQPPHSLTFIHRQTMQGAMRFSTVELADLDSRIASAGDKALAIELERYANLAAHIVAQMDAIKQAADALAVMDVSLAFAELADDLGYVRPEISTGLAFDIEGGRHPVVEAALKRNGEAFVANHANLSPPDRASSGRIQIITGPNMAGKSTYLRQNA
jgi:DNA mismatch repair protein MutS